MNAEKDTPDNECDTPLMEATQILHMIRDNYGHLPELSSVISAIDDATVIPDAAQAEKLTPDQQALVLGYLLRYDTPMKTAWALFRNRVMWLISRGETEDDISQNAMVGLMHAARRFDPSRGTNYDTYASAWIGNALSHRISYLNSAKRTPPEGKAVFSGHRSKDGSRGNSAFEGIPGRSLKSEIVTGSDKLRDVLRRINTREASILRQRFGLDCDKKTLRECADQISISRERVRQIEVTAIDKVRKLLRSNGVTSVEEALS